MENKEIYIDGVDVSGCEYHSLNKNNCSLCSLSNNLICSYKPFCYYKQLKRKEQECEELEIDKIFLEAHINDLTSPVNVEDCEHSVHNGEYIACSYYGGCRCDDLDFANCMFRENARLKEKLDQLKSDNKHLNDLLNQALKDYDKARETLTEIKEIAEHCINKDICTFCDYSDKCYIEDEEIPTYDVCKLILQKISEVENGI